MELFGAKNSNDSITLYFVQDLGSNNKEMRNAFTVSLIFTFLFIQILVFKRNLD